MVSCPVSGSHNELSDRLRSGTVRAVLSNRAGVEDVEWGV